MNIVFCLPGKSFSAAFLQSWTALSAHCQHKGISTVLSTRYSSNVYYVRSMCLGADVLRGRKQLPFNGKINYDYIMWIDSDILFTPEHFDGLLKHTDKDIVAGMYPMEGGTLYPIVKKWDQTFFEKNGMFEFLQRNDEAILNGEPFPVAYTGFGFVLIKKGVFETIEYPWFPPEFFEFKNGEIYDFCSEDVGFCRKATKAGFKIWIDPSIVVKHEKSIAY